MNTKRIRCSCKHPYQDKRYGKGKRVHNRLKKTAGGKGWRCTVCGQEKQS